MKLPKFPDDFYSFHDGVDVSDEEINEWIQEGIKFLEINGGNDYTISSGNTTVAIHKYYYDDYSDEYYYDIRVSKGYYQADTYDEKR
jgi:hypothetical protein